MSGWVTNGMRRRRNLYAVLILFFLAGMTTTGCAEKPTQQENVEPVQKNQIHAPVLIKYTVANPIEVLEVKDDTVEGTAGETIQEDFFSYSYIQITGLKDPELEHKINEKLMNAYQNMRIQDMPPYRGIKAKIPEGSVIIQENVYMMVTGNFNHVLSVMIQKNTTYSAGRFEKETNPHDSKYFENTHYVSEMQGLNIDLNTGEDITLASVFCDNVDYMPKLNRYMSNYLSSNYAEEEGYYTMSGDLKLVAPFQGLSEDQKFVLYPYGISLIMDYETPQFDTRFMAVSPFLYFSEMEDTIAITKRYYIEEKNLFTNDAPKVKSLPVRYLKQDIGGNDYYKDGFLNIYTNWRYSSKLPNELQNLLVSYTKVNHEEIQAMKELMAGYTQEQINEMGEGSYENSVYADIIGDYVNVSNMIYRYVPNQSSSKLEYHCYQLEPYKELSLEDLFVEGYDYRPVILEVLRKNLLEQGPGLSNPEVYDQEEIQGYYDQIKGFNLSAESVIIPIYGLEEENRAEHMVMIEIPYTQLGCEQMKIFE